LVRAGKLQSADWRGVATGQTTHDHGPAGSMKQMRESRIAARFSAGLDRFFAPQPMLAIVIGRVALGAILFLHYASKWPSVQAIYGPEGLGGARLHDRVAGIATGRPLEAAAQWLHLISSPVTIWVLYAILLLTSLSFAMGAFTRFSGTLALLLHTLFHAHTFTATLGWAVLLKSFLIFVIFARSGAYASIDSWRRHRRDSTGAESARHWMGPGWPVRLLQMQVCGMYAISWLRLDDPGWRNGSMVFAAVGDRWYGRFAFDWFDVLPLLAVLSHLSLVLELLAPLLLWVPALGRWWALGLIALHANLELFANVGWWQPLMIAMLLNFLPISWLAPLVEWPASTLARLRTSNRVAG
jgi:hypothetical protein